MKQVNYPNCPQFNRMKARKTECEIDFSQIAGAAVLYVNARNIFTSVVTRMSVLAAQTLNLKEGKPNSWHKVYLV